MSIWTPDSIGCNNGYCINSPMENCNIFTEDMAFLNPIFSYKWIQDREGAVYLLINGILKKYLSNTVAWDGDGLIVCEPTATNKCLVDGIPQDSVEGIEVLHSKPPVIESLYGKNWYVIEIKEVVGDLICNINGLTGNTNPHSYSTECFATSNLFAMYVGPDVAVPLSPDVIKNENYIPTSTNSTLRFKSINAPIGAKLYFRLPQLVESPYLGSTIVSSKDGPVSRSATTQTRKKLSDEELGLISGKHDGVELIVNGDFSQPGVGNAIAASGATLENVGNQLSITPDVSSGFHRAQWDSSYSDGDLVEISADIITVSGSCRFIDISNNDGYALNVGAFRQRIILGAAAASYGFGGNNDPLASLTIDNVSIQKVSPIRTEISTQWVPGADWDVGLGSDTVQNIISVSKATTSILYFQTIASVLIWKAWDGVNASAKFFLEFQANTAYNIKIRCGNETDMLQPNGDPLTGLAIGNWFQIGVDGVWGTPSVFTDQWPIDIDENGDAWIYLAYSSDGSGPSFPMQITPPVIRSLE